LQLYSFINLIPVIIMRTFIAIVAFLMFSVSAQSQEISSRKATPKLSDQIGVTLFDVSANAETLLLKKDQVVKIKSLNEEVSNSKKKITQKEYSKSLAAILTKEQMEKWKKKAMTKKLPLKKVK